MASVSFPFAKHDLGTLSRGEIVRVSLKGSAANVRLMDSSNLRKYEKLEKHQYTGGLVKSSPFDLIVPRHAHWFVTVDLVGLKGSFKSSVHVLPKPLPVARAGMVTQPSVPVHQRLDRNLFSISTSPAKQYDVFISYASEDRIEVARPLSRSLEDAGLEVWYDDRVLRIGSNLREEIDKGLANSRFGVVVFSHHFFSKNWPQYELDGLVTKDMHNRQTILPIWHGVTKEEVESYSPSLAQRLARNTSDYDIDAIATEIAEVVQEAKA